MGDWRRHGQPEVRRVPEDPGRGHARGRRRGGPRHLRRRGPPRGKPWPRRRLLPAALRRRQRRPRGGLSPDHRGERNQRTQPEHVDAMPRCCELGALRHVRDAPRAGRVTQPDRGENVGGYTPLHHAVRGNHLQITELLLLQGADPNAQETGNGFTPLHLCTKGLCNMAKLLMAKGADISQCDNDGTPRHTGRKSA